MTDTVDCIVIGAGVVGLAVARRMAMAGQDVVVLEAEGNVGSHTSSRNSEVVHAGLYYPAGSLKGRLCVGGKKALYAYCEQKGVPHARLGKLIVAGGGDEEIVLGDVEATARGNGVDDLCWLTPREVAAREPEVVATAALFSPSTGIVDTHALMLSLQGDLEIFGGTVVLRHRVDAIEVESGGFSVLGGGVTRSAARCRLLVNSAGLWAPSLARRIDRLDAVNVPKAYLAKGHYFAYSGPSPFRHLIYPVPIVGGLGIHATNDLAGCVRFGPDAEWVDEIDYAFDERKKEAFVAAIHRYFPALDPGKLSPSYTGLRPKLYPAGAPPADFVIQDGATHGIEGLVNLFGIESPGLTSALAIADHVHDLLLR